MSLFLGPIGRCATQNHAVAAVRGAGKDRKGIGRGQGVAVAARNRFDLCDGKAVDIACRIRQLYLHPGFRMP